MAQREPKSRTSTAITIVGRDGSAKGAFEITSGNLAYKRAGAKSITGQWTLQQLVEVLERDLADRQPVQRRISIKDLSRGHDFSLSVNDQKGLVVEENEEVISEAQPLRKIAHEYKLKEGAFRIDTNGRKRSLGFTWSAQISIVTAIYVLDLYIRKWLLRKPRPKATGANVAVSKAKLEALLRQWLTEIRA
jgi:hypothetical protein